MHFLFLALLLTAPPEDDFMPTVSAAFLRVKQADARQTTLTRFDLEHNWNIKDNGQRLGESTKLYEQTWINDLPYKRLVERNGKPLAGDELAQEQKRLDQFIADHKPLDDNERACINHGKIVHSTLDFARIQTPAYRITQIGVSQCIGRPCHVYLAEPAPNAAPDRVAKPYVYKLWITDSDPLLTRLTFTLPAGASGSDHETTGTLEWELFNGEPVESRTAFVGFLKGHGTFIEVHTDDIFTRYRRFTTTTRILPADPQ